MSSTVSVSQSPLPDSPAFLIGVTGNLDVTNVEELKDRVRSLFRLLKPDFAAADDADARWRELLEAFLKQLPDTSPSNGPAAKEPYRAGLKSWPRLIHTPVFVLSSLAPGADMLVAEVVLELEFQQNGFHLIAPLPLPPAVYESSSSFVWDQPAGNSERQSKFREVVTSGAQRYFTVVLAEDLELTKSQLDAAHAAALTNQNERHLRYRAAGEFMAAYSHLMIAIWDHHFDARTEAGTAAIVKARREGPQPLALATTSPLAMPHGGPTLHIYTRRQKNNSEIPETPPIRFLQARTTKPRASAPDDDAEWQERGLALLTSIATNLDRFNESPSSDARTNRELGERLKYEAYGREASFAEELQAKSPQLHKRLHRLAALRRRASDASAQLDRRNNWTLLWLFLFTFAAAASLDSFAHWHPQSTHREHQDPESVAASPEGHSQGHPHPPLAGDQDGNDHPPAKTFGSLAIKSVQPLLGGVAVLSAVLALIWYWRRRSQHHEERAHDYRAVAEGARVQFYWQLSGLPDSVSANYMDRQRNELDWIRAAVRSVSFPYEEARGYFAELQPADQVTALRCVLHSWISDQATYFSTKSRRYERELHAWHKLGRLLALAGVILAPVLAVDAVFDSHMKWLHGWPWVALLPAAIFLAIGFFAWAKSRKRHHDSHAADEDRPWWHSWLDLAVPTDHPDRLLHDTTLSRQHLLKNFAQYVPGAAILAGGILGAVALAVFCPALPGAYDLTIIMVGCLLIGGAMAVAWAERRLYSELAYQYHTMLSLFQNARIRVSEQISELAALDPQTKRAEFDRQLQLIQAAIRSLGMEALDENAEWLILHRSRPLEPVMAG